MIKTNIVVLTLVGLAILVAADYRPIGDGAATYFKRYINKEKGSNGLAFTYNPRNISNLVASTGSPAKSALNISMMEVFFAQFINHDLERNEFVNDLYYMPVYPGDRLYGLNATNNYIIARYSYTELVSSDDDDNLSPQLLNNNSKLLDLSTVYGSNNETSEALRLYSGGKLKTSAYTAHLGPFVTLVYSDLAPSQAYSGLTTSSPVSTGPDTVLTSGDDRVDENIAMALINSAFIRRHNQHATNLSTLNSDWDDEKLFQEARKITIAEYQHIVFDEYIPVVLGPITDSIRKYRGYDDEVDTRTSIEFASGAFRYGHSAVSPYNLIQANGSLYRFTLPAGIFGPFPITSSQLPFAGQLGGPLNVATALATAGGIGNVLRGLINSVADDVDIQINDVIRNIVFGGSIGRGVDLLAVDIFRGRNNGLPSYHELRKKFYNVKGLPAGDNNIYQACGANKNDPNPDAIACFDLITSNHTLALALQSIYGKVNNIDGLVGLLSENRYPGAVFSRTTAGIIAKEYQTKRDGDPWWYEAILTDDELSAVKSVRLSTILSSVYNLTGLPDNVFVVS